MSSQPLLRHSTKLKPSRLQFLRLRRVFAITVVLAVCAVTVMATISFITKWGSSGGGNGQFNTPTGIATDVSGNVYVAEGNGNRFQKFDNNGNFLMAAGISGDVPGGFVSPSGIAVDSLGNIYVTDAFTARTSKFNAAGTYQSSIGPSNFLAPTGVAVDSANNVYIVDSNNHRVRKYDSSGAFISQWGSIGSADGQFNGPQGLAIDQFNNVYVADSGNNRIQKFTSAGVFVTKWGTAGSANGEFNTPNGVSADTAGNVFVADSGNSRIQSFTSTGTFNEAFGTGGTGDGEFSGPQDLAADAFGNIFVADTGNDRVQKLGTAAAPVVADAGPDQTVECEGVTTTVTLDGTGSTGSGTLTYTWKEGATVLGMGDTLEVELPLGPHTITLTVSSSNGGSDDDEVLINVVDTVAPTITLIGPDPMTVECHTVFVDPGATASDGCAGDLTGAITVSGTVDTDVVGSYELTYMVSDGTNSTSKTRTVNVVDTTAPVITLNGVTPVMWPPNHNYHTFSVADFVSSVTEGCDTSLSIADVVISQVTSDEPENGSGDGNTLNDIVIAADCKSVQLRSERDGGGDGRVYTITFTVTDESGNTGTATAMVFVPKSQGSGAPVNSGVHYSVSGSCP